MSDDDALIARARAWQADDPDRETQAELGALIDKKDLAELASRMAGPLTFGTAGLRARVGAGETRMNRATVIRATRGLADFLAANRSGARSLPVVVGFDARLSSPELAREVVAVLIGARIPVRYFEEPVPTPIAAYAARVLGATAAVVVTASHNPKDDNGYKLYLDGAVQAVTPDDDAVERAIAEVGPAREVPRVTPEENRNAPAVSRVDAQAIDLEPLLERYYMEIEADLGASAEPKALRIAYTPLHGVGGRFTERALARAGFDKFFPVPEQAEPDGNFPTAHFPNPENPKVLELGIALAKRERCDILLVNDPDADRLAAAAPRAEGEWVPLTGNQIGALLADDVLRRHLDPKKALVLTSLVTSPLVGDIAVAYGAHFERTLTGFKWIWTGALDLESETGKRYAFGCEEALGYSVPRAVRDKDGVSAAVALAALAERLRAENETLFDRLAEIAERHGLYVSTQLSVGLSGPAALGALTKGLDAIVKSPPKVLGSRSVRGVVDYRTGAEKRRRWLGQATLVELELDGGRVLIRPSGTEPKFKIYVDLKAEPKSGASLAGLEAALTEEAQGVARAALQSLGIPGEDKPWPRQPAGAS